MRADQRSSLDYLNDIKDAAFNGVAGGIELICREKLAAVDLTDGPLDQLL